MPESPQIFFSAAAGVPSLGCSRRPITASDCTFSEPCTDEMGGNYLGQAILGSPVVWDPTAPFYPKRTNQPRKTPKRPPKTTDAKKARAEESVEPLK
ncbi:MAG: hypothetical protein CMJ72_01590 [Planctomycetaceae bacterium]|nr:hypothetical protein [Planctomycetaceae bacterium]